MAHRVYYQRERVESPCHAGGPNNYFYMRLETRNLETRCSEGVRLAVIAFRHVIARGAGRPLPLPSPPFGPKIHHGRGGPLRGVAYQRAHRVEREQRGARIPGGESPLYTAGEGLHEGGPMVARGRRRCGGLAGLG